MERDPESAPNAGPPPNRDPPFAMFILLPTTDGETDRTLRIPDICLVVKQEKRPKMKYSKILSSLELESRESRSGGKGKQVDI